MPHTITIPTENPDPEQGFNWISRHPALAVGFLLRLAEAGRLDDILTADLQQLHLRLGALVQRSLHDE